MEELSAMDVTVEELKASTTRPVSNPDDAEEVVTVQAVKTPEELVAKFIAPVKREFLRPPPSRNSNNDQKEVVSDSTPAPVLKEKKSKRQLKRERRQEQKSALHLCPEVAKSGQVSSCPYNEKCRFSHDIEAFTAQKPDDLEGNCPFLIYDGPCPYGLACRFSSTHKEDGPGSMNCQKKRCETNGLNKDVQKLLWKNKMKFHKADTVLKRLGLMGPKNSRQKKDADVDDIDRSQATVENGGNEMVNDSINKIDNTPEVTEDDEQLASDECRPLKKTKSFDCPTEEDCGAQICDNDIKENFVKQDSAAASDTLLTGDDSSLKAKICENDIKENFVRHDSAAASDTLLTDDDNSLKLHAREKKHVDFRDKLYLAPLTTVGNLPFRRVCKVLGADITCGEMAMCTNLLQGQASEWALLRRHSSEDLFGVQICGAFPDTVARTVELITQECGVDFIDINMGCPIDIVVNKGAGSALLTKPMRMKGIIQAAHCTVNIPITVKVRTGYFEGRNRIDSIIEDIGNWGATAVTVHGRSRQQRYSKLADWEYIYQCTRKAPKTLQVLGNGDAFSYLDWNNHKNDCPELSTCMIARGALIKPWIFTEIKEQRHWDISSGERLDIFKDYVQFGLEHWGSDSKGVETTRHFLLEWLSYTHRYIPVGLLDIVPQRLNWRPPSYYGRNDLETLMASDSAADWIRISEMLLGKVPNGFTFAPKHKSNAYDRAENG